MRFSDAFLEEIRQRLPISQVVGEHVTWDKRKSQPGRGDMWACCPFHGEKTPSFHADDRKGIYHCFGCGATGDHFRFLTEKTGISFPEAVEKLAGMAGVPMPARDERAEARDAVRRSLYDVMELAARYFEAALDHNIGARARGYLNSRGVSPAQQQRFRIGFAPDARNGLKEHLAANGVSADEMRATGLVAEREGDPLPYDRFRNRVMFPITDFRGRVIAFGGRALSPDVPAKYLNSPETELFHKRSVLYNGQGARRAAHDGAEVIVVEGYLDVVATVSAGFEGTLAPLGTALTEDHLQLLWRMADIPILCFDGDEAGQKAAERAVGLVLPELIPGKSVRIAHLPEGQDPDDLIRAEGPTAFRRVLDDATPLSEALFDIETRGVMFETPEARAALEGRLRTHTSAIRDVTVRRYYVQVFDEKLDALFRPAMGWFLARARQQEIAKRFGKAKGELGIKPVGFGDAQADGVGNLAQFASVAAGTGGGRHSARGGDPDVPDQSPAFVRNAARNAGRARFRHARGARHAALIARSGRGRRHRGRQGDARGADQGRPRRERRAHGAGFVPSGRLAVRRRHCGTGRRDRVAARAGLALQIRSAK